MTVKSLRNKTHFQKGQTLIEAVAAMGMAVLILTSLTVAVIVALKNATFSKGQNVASNFAQQAVEVLRDMRNSNWTLFNSYNNGTYCLPRNSSTLVNKSGDYCDLSNQKLEEQDAIYIREIKLEKDSADCLSSSSLLLTPTPTPSTSRVYLNSNVSCTNGLLTPNDICRNAGYNRAITDSSGYAAKGYWWWQCAGASVTCSIPSSLDCTINVNDCAGSTQSSYPANFIKLGISSTVYLPEELGGSCASGNPGWTMRVSCEQSVPPPPGVAPDLGRLTKVVASVYWRDSKCTSGTVGKYCHKVELTSCFAERELVPGP